MPSRYQTHLHQWSELGASGCLGHLDVVRKMSKANLWAIDELQVMSYLKFSRCILDLFEATNLLNVIATRSRLRIVEPLAGSDSIEIWCHDNVRRKEEGFETIKSIVAIERLQSSSGPALELLSKPHMYCSSSTVC